MTRAEVMAEARRWVGTPYRHAGRSALGLDCIGLVVVVGQAFAVPHEDIQHYTGWADPERRMLGEFDRWLVLCRQDDPWPGTMGVFHQTGLPCHVGLFSTLHDTLHLVHAMLPRRRVVEEPWQPGMSAPPLRLVRRYRFPALEA